MSYKHVNVYHSAPTPNVYGRLNRDIHNICAGYLEMYHRKKRHRSYSGTLPSVSERQNRDISRLLKACVEDRTSDVFYDGR